jgi:hypothetical protein
VGPNRQGRLLVLALALAAGGCKKGKDSAEAPQPDPKVEEEQPAADPHAGMKPSDPHAGMGDPHGGGKPSDPHGGMAMGDKPAGKSVEKAADGKSIVGPLLLAIPDPWKNEPAGGMRAAQWLIPGPKGAADASLVAFYFGQGGGGSVEDNLNRWYGQFQPEGKKALEPKTEKKKVAGMPVTLTEVEGRYVAAMQPGAAEKYDEPGWMMLAAIVETPEGAYFFKLTGPKATVAAARKGFRTAIDTASLKK